MLMLTRSTEETIKAGEELGHIIRAENPQAAAHRAVLLYGGMGTGKTHFVKGLAKGLGINASVTSPTFTLVNEYEDKMFHFDLFRISSQDDLYAIGFYDYIGRGVIVCEWSENVSGIEREFGQYYKVEIIKTGENERNINVTSRS